MGDCCHSKKLNKTKGTKNNHNYLIDKTKLSGDVHPNPGPTNHRKPTPTPPIQKKKIKLQQTADLHIVRTLIILIIILNYLQNSKFKGHSKITHHYMTLIRYEIKRNTKPLNKTKRLATHLCIMLILLSRDVHVNPGPTGIEVCSKCTREIKENSRALKCETCQQWCHDQCEATNTMKIIHTINESNCSWICPNTHCKPNYNCPTNFRNAKQNDCQGVMPPNRYNILLTCKEQMVKQRRSQCSTVKKAPKHKSNNQKKLNLWNELTKISPGEYEGKEICKGCNRHIKRSQQALSCDNCQRWLHQKCSDMSEKTYKVNKKKNNFPWICNVCRVDDCHEYERANLQVLKEEEKPESLETLKSSTSKKELHIINMNFRSINNKFEELLHICQELQPDIICITETWLDDSVPTNTCIPPGYRMIRKDRSEEYKQKYGRNKGGGIAIYYKEHLKVERKDYLTDAVEEILWVQVKTKASFMLGVVYRAEYTDIISERPGESKLEENIRKASEISNRLILTGDLNIDIKSKSELANQLKDVYKSYGLSQYVKKPTRVNPKNGKATLIDHIWSNKEINLIKKAGTFTGVSDHFGTYMKLNVQQQAPQKETIRYRCFKNYNGEDYRNDLNSKLNTSDINKYIDDNDVNKATEELIKMMQETADIHAPEKEFKVGKEKNKVKWFSDDLKEKIKQKNELLSDYFTSGAKSLYERANKLKNDINHMKRKLKKAYYTEKIEEADKDSKKLWQLLKEITGTGKNKDSVEPEMLTQEKVNSHNKFLATVGAEIQKQLKVQNHPTDYTALKGFQFKEEKNDDVVKLIDRIRIDVAVGSDKISAKLIKDAKLIIAPFLTRIINAGYKTSTFPDSMKTTVIKPLHKKKSIDDIANYRPISILPTLSKVYERAASNQIINYLESQKKLSKCQHAYRSMHSTLTCLVEVLNHIYKMIDQKRCIAVASLDLSKAFDSISHTLILHKLSKLGIGEECLNWIKSYLKDRKQRTKFKNFTSTEETVVSGIPQGSIIGPLLFICFTNDLSAEFTDCKIVAYADDSQLIVDAENIVQLKSKIEKVIKTAQKWYEANSMKNNIGKTEILSINCGQRKHHFKVTVMDEGKPVVIETKECIKVLGVKLDHTLSWKKQINAVKRKAMNVIRNLNRINHLLPIRHRIQLYKSLVEPNFNYADVAWGGCGVTNAKSLQLAQNFAARSILGMRKSASATTALNKLKLLNLKQRRTVHETVFTHKSLINKHPENINSTYQQQLPRTNTRGAAAGRLNIPKHNTAKYEQSPLYRTIKSWNAAPTDMNKEDVQKHKAAYQRLLLASTH